MCEKANSVVQKPIVLFNNCLVMQKRFWAGRLAVLARQMGVWALALPVPSCPCNPARGLRKGRGPVTTVVAKRASNRPIHSLHWRLKRYPHQPHREGQPCAASKQPKSRYNRLHPNREGHG